MQRYTNTAVLREDSINTGNADEAAPVKVYLAGTTTLATLFADDAGTIPLAQPFLTNTLGQTNPGRFTFVTNVGFYDIVINEGEGESRIDGVVIQDVKSGVVDVRWFGALLDDTTDDVSSFDAALADANVKEVIFDANAFISGSLTIPAGKKLTGVGIKPELRLPTGSALTKSGCTLTNLKTNFDGGSGQLGDSTVDGVSLVNVESYGSTNSGVIFNAVCSNILLDRVIGRDNAKSGITVNQITTLTIKNCSTLNNGQSGLGIQNSDQVKLLSHTTKDNGTGGNYGGCSVATSTNVTVDGVLSSGNQEHGIGLQGTKYFTVDNVITYSNGGSGFNMQEDNATGSTAHGSVCNIQSYNNNIGFTSKEVVEDVLFTNCNFSENTTYSVRLVDIGSSGKKSDQLTFRNCAFKFTTGTGFVNSNDSTRISNPQVDNRFQASLYPSLQVFDDISSGYGTTIDTKGVDERAETFPEIFYIAGGTVQNTETIEAVRGRAITFITQGGVTFTHNTGTGLAKFRNFSLADVVLTANQSISYVANGADWIESA